MKFVLFAIGILLLTVLVSLTIANKSHVYNFLIGFVYSASVIIAHSIGKVQSG